MTIFGSATGRRELCCLGVLGALLTLRSEEHTF